MSYLRHRRVKDTLMVPMPSSVYSVHGMMYNLDLNMSVSDGSKSRLCKILSLCLFDNQMNQMNWVGAHKCPVTHTKFCYLCPYIFLLRNQVMYVYIPFQGGLYYISLAVDICFNYILDATEIRRNCVSVTPVSLNIVILSVKWALMSSEQCQWIERAMS